MSVIDFEERRRLREAAEALSTPHVPAAPENHIDAGRAQFQQWHTRDKLRGHQHDHGYASCPVCSLHDREAHKRDRIGHNTTCPRCSDLAEAYVIALATKRNA